MSYCKIMVCDYFYQEYKKKSSQIILEEKLKFKRNCQHTYGSHRNFIMICKNCSTGIRCTCGYEHSYFVCSLNLINNQIKKYCILSNYLSKIFDFYDSNIHTLFKFLKSLRFEDFRFYFSICYNKIRIKQI